MTPSPLREPSETPEAIEPEREALEEVIAIAHGQGQTTAEIAAFILAAGFRRSALPVETPTDTERLDWLEGEMNREAIAIREGRKLPNPLFRKCMPITREAIDAARLADTPQEKP